MLGIGQVVLEQGGDLLAIGAEQFDLRRRGAVGPAVYVDAGVAGEAGAVHARRLRQALRLTALQRYRVDLAFARAFDAGTEVGLAGRLIHRQQLVHRPVAVGQRGGLAVAVDAVQVLEAGALGRPQYAAVFKEAQAVVQRHPGRAGFVGEHALAVGVECHFHQVQLLLVARLALEAQVLRIAPIDAGQVDVLFLAQVDPARLRLGGRCDHAQLHAHIGVTGGRVTLFDHIGAVGVDLVALLHRHRCLVDARERDGRIVRCPPVTGVAVHLFIGDELGHAVADGGAAVAGQLQLLSTGQVDHPQVAAADEADEAALGRQLGVGGEAFTMGQLAHRRLALLLEVVQVQLAAQREQQALRVRRPLVIDDAGHRGDALALAAGLLLVAEGLGAGQHHLGINQQPGLATVDVVGPQVQLVAVAVLAAQEADLRTVGRHLRLHQGRAGQRQRAGDGFQGQLFSVGGGTGGEHEGERSEQVAHGGSRQTAGPPPRWTRSGRPPS